MIAQLEIPLDVVSVAFAHAIADGAVTVLNPAPALDVPDELLRNTRIVIPNEHERLQLGGLGRLFGLGVELVITTMGGAGVEIVTPSSNRTVAPFPVTPLDTTGAGDAFCGAFAAALAGGAAHDRRGSLRRRGGSAGDDEAGAVPSLPRRAEIDRLLTSG